VTPTRRALITAGGFEIGPAIVAGLIFGFLLGAVVAVVAFLVVGAAFTAWARLGGDRVVASRVGGRAADPVAEARLCNLVEGLATSVGLRQPQVFVVESPGLNTLAAGTSSTHGFLAVTSGLLAELERIELEAVIAEQLWRIRHDQALPGTVLAATFGVGSVLGLDRLALAPDADATADQGAITVTRYPPALAAALEKIDSKGAIVDRQPAFLAHLWLADPRPSPPSARGRLPLAERTEALREL
jgi:heat shock protein HtpX